MSRAVPALVRALAALAVSCGAAGVGARAFAEEHRLHERIVDPNRENSPLVEQPAEGRNPSALRLPRDRGEIAEPRHGDALRPGEQPFELGRPPSTAESHQRLRQWRPDLATARVSDQLEYHSSFNPSVAPHKRISALDRVGPGYTLDLAPSELTEVPVGGTAQPDRDLFWGSVFVRFVPDQPVPIPSVAPGARILSVRVTPARTLRFYHDGADNYYVVSDRGGEGRIVFVTDGPSSYFGGALPPSVRSSDVPAHLRPSIPAGVQRAVDQVAARLGLDRAAPMARNLTRLVTYLRSFESEPLEGSASGDRYLTLAFGRRGVCRHRAFVFVVTAQGLGIPARFVTNEVHAFSEVYVPTLGWFRVDLGGEAPLAPEREPVARHEPREPDPFPWPPGSREPGRATSTGGRGDLASAGAEPRPDPNARPRSGTDPGQEPPEPSAPPAPAGEDAAASLAAEDAEAPDSAPAESPRRRLAVFLDSRAASVVRGESLTLSGAVRDAAGPAARARVTLWIRGGRGGRQIRLGRASCDDSGRFRARFAVPGTVPTGTYQVIARAEPPQE